MTKEYLKKLFITYYRNEASMSEIEELLNILSDDKNKKMVFDALKEIEPDYTENIALRDFKHQALEKILTKTQTPIIEHTNQHFFTLNKYLIAASILVIFCFTYFLTTHYYSRYVNQSNKYAIKSLNQDEKPNSNHVILQNSNGKTIMIDTLSSEVYLEKSFIQKQESKDQEKIYSFNSGTETEQDEITWNTIRTPKEKQLQLELPDGTIAWLNAQSSIKFPSRFYLNEREISIEGEVYLDVAKNPQKPFIVNISNKLKIDVLGTQFNVNAYHNTAEIETTLVEGSLKISSSESSILLSPNQQSRYNKERSTLKLNSNCSVDQVTSWKRGCFTKGKINIKNLMEKISAWYNLDVEFNDEIDFDVVASIPQDISLQKFIEIMELTNKVTFKKEPNKIIIMKKNARQTKV